MSENHHSTAYWNSTIKIALGILTVWAFVSFGCGILFREWLDENMPTIGNAPFGFWMAQQGSIIVFVALLFTYTALMNKLDRKHGYDDEGEA